MKTHFEILLVVATMLVFTSSLQAQSETPSLREQSLVILQNKCNACHKKESPFKVFKDSNLKKHAKNIYEQVFVYKLMPKPEGEALTNPEKETLLAWLETMEVVK